MTELRKQLLNYEPSSLWSLAPSDLLKRGSGLLATGELISWYWSSKGEFVSQFPVRLDTILCRISLDEGTLRAQCDCRQNPPCEHFAATLMTVVHLTKGFNAFGRYPSPIQAAELKTRLIGDAVPDEPIETKQHRHVLIRPQAESLFTFRTSLDPRVPDSNAAIPSALYGFVAAWTYDRTVESDFWNWVGRENRKIPVYIQRNGKPEKVESFDPKGRSKMQLHLELIDSTVIISQKLAAAANQGEDEEIESLGIQMAYLPAKKTLVKLSSNPGPVGWRELEDMLEDEAKDLGLEDQFELKPGQILVSTTIWNAAKLPWSPSQPPAHFRWKKTNATPQPIDRPNGHIELNPLEDEVLAVQVSVSSGEARYPCLDPFFMLAHHLEHLTADRQLVSSKVRRQVILEAIYGCWLAETPEQKGAFIKAVEQNESAFKNQHQASAAARLVRQLKDGPPKSEVTQSTLLLASPQEGWMAVSRTHEVAAEVTALTLGLLEAEDPEEDFDEDFPEDPTAVRLELPLAVGMSRLPMLSRECNQRGITLTYAGQLVTSQTLTLKVEAKVGKKPDWFELKPEVHCGGELIPQDKWTELLKTGNYVNSEGRLVVIDLTQTEGLERLKHIIDKQRRDGDAEGKEVLKVPRLRVLDWLALRKHGVECSLPESEHALLESLVTFDALRKEELPAIRATLREYQHDGYSWMAFLYKHGFGACLADDMGLGKTVQTITLMAAIREGKIKSLTPNPDEKRPHLLVLPPTLLFNWQAEIKTFYPDLYVHEYTGKGRSLIGINEGVVLTTYELARRDIDTLKDKTFDCIIFDEAQAVKNVLGERARAMRQLQGRFKLCLTGTPLENHAGEYFSIIDLALPGLLGERKTFLEDIKNPARMFNPLERARPFVLRRTKDKILKELPPKVESDVQLELTEQQKKFYTRLVGEVRAEVLAAFEGKTAQQAGIVALAALTRLRQVCVSPGLIDPEYTEASPKITYLCDKLEELSSERHAALVFSQFTRALDHLEIHLKKAGLAFQRLDGSTPQPKRKTLVEQFQKGTGPGIFLISLKAGGAGLNLTRASYVFHLDPWWNPAVESQASDRAHRMGQKNTVFIQRLLMLHTVEEKIMQLKAVKRQLFDQVMSATVSSEASGQGSVITKDDFRFLLG